MNKLNIVFSYKWWEIIYDWEIEIPDKETKESYLDIIKTSLIIWRVSNQLTWKDLEEAIQFPLNNSDSVKATIEKTLDIKWRHPSDVFDEKYILIFK